MEILILYSNQSKRCRKFLSALEKDTIIDAKKLKRLCIDHPNIRKSIVSQNMVPVTQVPSVLVKMDDNVDIYEGDETFTWLSEFSDYLYNQIREAEEKKQQEMNALIEAEAQARAEQKIQEQQQRLEEQQKAQKRVGSVKSQASQMMTERGLQQFDKPSSASVPHTNIEEQHTLPSVITPTTSPNIPMSSQQVEQQRKAEEEELKQLLNAQPKMR